MTDKHSIEENSSAGKIEAIEEALADQRSVPENRRDPTDSEPYVGPRPFERKDEFRFFGRGREARDLADRVIAHAEVLLYAPSGAGKTSLIEAQLIPLLEQEKCEVLPPARVQEPPAEGISPQNPFVFHTLLSWARGRGEQLDPARLQQLERSSLADYLALPSVPESLSHLPHPRILIFDQFEELFTFYPEHWKKREDFFRQIGKALDSNSALRVLFAIREDYIAQLDPYIRLLPERLRAIPSRPPEQKPSARSHPKAPHESAAAARIRAGNCRGIGQEFDGDGSHKGRPYGDGRRGPRRAGPAPGGLQVAVGRSAARGCSNHEGSPEEMRRREYRARRFL